MNARVAGLLAGVVPRAARRREQDWPYRTVVGPLAVLAVVLALVELLKPASTPHLGPAVLSAATVLVIWPGLRHSRGNGSGPTTWRALSVVACLLAFGQLLRAMAGVGVNPHTTGPSDVALAATGPVAVWLCVHLIRSNRGRPRARVVLDGAVALLALAVVVDMVVSVALGRPGADVDPLLSVGYPVIGAILCAVGLVTLAGVSAARRRAAGWLLTCFASLLIAMLAGSVATVSPSPLLDVLTSTGYLVMLAAGTLALAVDPGPRPDAESSPAAVPLVGLVLSYCLSFGGTVLLLIGWATGRPRMPAEMVLVALLLLLTFVRTLMWAAEGARLTRQVVGAEAYFRTLVNRAADVTIVLDDRGQISWVTRVSGAPANWTVRELQGRPLVDLVHEDDRAEFSRALWPEAVAEGPPPVFRVRSRDGQWLPLEVVSTTSSAGLPGAPFGSSGEAEAGERGEGLVLHLRDVAERRRTELELERLAYSDFLTGLPNRARLMAAIAAARARAVDGDKATLLLLDLDGFKPVNDIAGHEAGDHLLVQVADRLRHTVRDRDLIGRLGGDEFAVLVRSGVDEATVLAERIVADVASLRPSAPTDGFGPDAVFDISVSVGVAPIEPGEDLAATVRYADVALRAAKAAGKNCVRRHGDAADTLNGRRTRLAEDLPGAVERGELHLVFQPVIGVEERRVLGLEALVRWRHPELGPVPPDEFISIAEADGLIVPIQRWVLQRAMAILAPLLRDGRRVQLAVNISVRHLQAGCLAADVANALEASGVPASRLVIEITESVLMSAADAMDSDLGTLREMGCVLSLDDFGKGYSSLARLARLPFDILKMDREFVRHVEDDPRTRALVAAVVDLGRTLGVDVVAEGVETPAQLQVLREADCRFLQGYLLGRPVAPEDLRQVIDRFDPAVLDPSPAGPPTNASVTVHTVGRSG